MSNRKFLDAVIAYQEARKTENTHRASPPEKSVDQYADEAIVELNKLIAIGVRDGFKGQQRLGA